jgi:hypothetical protein
LAPHIFSQLLGVMISQCNGQNHKWGGVIWCPLIGLESFVCFRFTQINMYPCPMSHHSHLYALVHSHMQLTNGFFWTTIGLIGNTSERNLNKQFKRKRIFTLIWTRYKIFICTSQIIWKLTRPLIWICNHRVLYMCMFFYPRSNGYVEAKNGLLQLHAWEVGQPTEWWYSATKSMFASKANHCAGCPLL